jgi:hypothetical protein
MDGAFVLVSLVRSHEELAAWDPRHPSEIVLSVHRAEV